jgi:hypothetical protein
LRVEVRPEKHSTNRDLDPAGEVVEVVAPAVAI